MPIPPTTQALILTQVGDTATGTCAALIDSIWDSYADFGVVDIRLQRFYTQRECIDLVLGVLREQIDAGLVGDLEVKAQQKVLNLQAQRAAAVSTIHHILDQKRAQRAPATSQLSTTEISTPPTLGDALDLSQLAPDGNAPRYRGWPYPR